MFADFVVALVPGGARAQADAAREAVFEFEAPAELVAVDEAAASALARAGEQAHLGVGTHPPARPGVEGDRHLIEAAALVFPAGEVRAQAHAQALAQWMLILPSAPEDEAESRAFALELVAAERQIVDVDDLRIRHRADVRVRRDGKSEMRAPASARAHDAQETIDVGDHRLGRLAGENAIEVAAREVVLTLVEERPREFEPHAHQSGLLDEDDP